MKGERAMYLVNFEKLAIGCNWKYLLCKIKVMSQGKHGLLYFCTKYLKTIENWNSKASFQYFSSKMQVFV
jgi:hypothetical protein